jgi:hypothetical protein
MGKDTQTASKPIPFERNLIRKEDFFKVDWTLKTVKGDVDCVIVGECIGLTKEGYKFRLVWTDSEWLKKQFGMLPSEFMVFNMPYKLLREMFEGKMVIKSLKILTKKEALTYQI